MREFRFRHLQLLALSSSIMSSFFVAKTELLRSRTPSFIDVLREPFLKCDSAHNISCDFESSMSGPRGSSITAILK